TAIWTGWKRRLSSIRPATGKPVAGSREPVLRLVIRPVARGNPIQAGRILSEAVLVDPIIRHDPLDEVSRLPVRQAFEKQQWVRGGIVAPPFEKATGAG